MPINIDTFVSDFSNVGFVKKDIYIGKGLNRKLVLFIGGLNVGSIFHFMFVRLVKNGELYVNLNRKKLITYQNTFLTPVHFGAHSLWTLDSDMLEEDTNYTIYAQTSIPITFLHFGAYLLSDVKQDGIDNIEIIKEVCTEKEVVNCDYYSRMCPIENNSVTLGHILCTNYSWDILYSKNAYFMDDIKDTYNGMSSACQSLVLKEDKTHYVGWAKATRAIYTVSAILANIGQI